MDMKRPDTDDINRSDVDFPISPFTAIDSPIDQNAIDMAQRFGQLTSRRGFLAKTGRLILSVVGVSAISALPIPGNVEEVAAAQCGDWNLCGLCGRICTCCNGGNPLNYCPAGTNWFGYWSRCCSNPYGSGRLYYWDCCGGTVNCNSCLTCSNNCPQPAWCNGNPGSYKCTAVVSGSACF